MPARASICAAWDPTPPSPTTAILAVVSFCIPSGPKKSALRESCSACISSVSSIFGRATVAGVGGPFLQRRFEVILYSATVMAVPSAIPIIVSCILALVVILTLVCLSCFLLQ